MSCKLYPTQFEGEESTYLHQMLQLRQVRQRLAIDNWINLEFTDGCEQSSFSGVVPAKVRLDGAKERRAQKKLESLL